MASPVIEERRHVLDVAVPRALVVDGDPGRLAQVIANLLTNAAKYTDSAGASTSPAPSRDRSWCCVCATTAAASLPETLPGIFDLFAQERQDIDRSQGGLGLGLAIVRTLVHAHGGTVTANSDGKGRGSTFTLQLPHAITPAPAPEPSRDQEVRAIAVRGLRILVVDDNVDAAELLAESLEALGHVTHVTFDGPNALEAAGRFIPDVVMLDLGLPVMDGFEVAQRLKAEWPSGPALVAITGYGQDIDQQRTQTAGFDAHMVKPIDLDRLEAWLRSRRLPAEPQA